MRKLGSIAFGACIVMAWSTARAEEVASKPTKPPDVVTDVTAAGTKSTRLAGSAYVLKKADLDRIPHTDPNRVFLQVPGVYVRGEDGFGLRPNVGMRGANADRSKKVTLLEDGVLFAPAPYSAPAAYYFPLIQRMEAVRVFKGPASLAYGPQTIAGAIDLVTTSVPDQGSFGALDLSYGSFGARKADAIIAHGTDRFGIVIQGAHVGATGFKHVDGSNEDTGFSRNEWMVKTRFSPWDNPGTSTFQLKLGYSDEVSRETYLGLTDEDFRRDPYRRYRASSGDTMRWTRTQIEVTHRAELARDVSITNVFYTHELHREWDRFQDLSFASVSDVLANPRGSALGYGLLRGAVDSPNDTLVVVRGPNDRRFAAQGFQTTVRFTPRTGPVQHKIELGFRIHGDSITRIHEREDELVRGGAFVPAERPRYLVADNDASAVATAIHVTDSMTWGRVTVNPGVRVESIRSRFDDRLAKRTGSAYDLVGLPGLSAFVNVTRDFGLLGGVHKGMSPAAPGEPSQNHESAVNYEFGPRFSNRTVRADLIGFYSDYSNITSICSESSGCAQTNLDRQLAGGAARIAGLEAFFEASPIITDGWKLPVRASYTLTSAEFLDDFVAGDPTWGRVRRGDEMPYVPLHQAYAQVGIETKRFGVHVAGTYVGDMREKPGQGDVYLKDLTDPYFLLDVGAHYRPRDYLSVYFSGKNILDETYLVARRPFGARPGAPCTLQLGMKVSFR